MDKLAEKFAELAEKFGPNVVDAAKGAAVAQAYSTIASSLTWFAIAFAFCIVGKKVYGVKDEFGGTEVSSVAVYITWIVAALCLITGVWTVIDPWVWLTIKQPEIWIAKKILGF